VTSTNKGAYARAGVDIDAADKAKSLIKKHARSTFGPEVLTDIGLFGSLYRFKGYKQPVLVSSTDGVGTKLKIAMLMKKHDTVGIDIVNHCINDILACGASPLFFLDYIALAKLAPEKVEQIVSGMAKACRESGCALIGGETAEMPGLYHGDDYDLAGCIVGVVEKPDIITGQAIKDGDTVIGLPSSGLHTNGYSLARKVFNIDSNPAVLKKKYAGLGGTLGKALLEPHICYYPQIKPVLSKINGLAHITGGGFIGNIPRILPKGLGVTINKKSWEIPPIFKFIQKQGNVDEAEMYRVFNMGIGMVVICSPGKARNILGKLPGAVVIGRVNKAQKTEIILLK
jgi:phosphoribosylformylglycinamidine cyclo-ligase